MKKKNLLITLALAAALVGVACGEPGDRLDDSQSALQQAGAAGEDDDADTDSDSDG